MARVYGRGPRREPLATLPRVGFVAPLVARELEQRINLLAWTQGVTRRRWLTTKLIWIIGGALLAAGIITALMIWWRGSFDQLYGRLTPTGFDFQGVAPFAYMAFALALTIAAGILLRRAIPAMTVTLAGFAVVRLLIANLVRPYLYQPPITQNASPFSAADPSTLDWSLSSGFVDHSGHALSDEQVFSTCAPNSPANKSDLVQCGQAHAWLIPTVYQPADRFWRFQITEALIYLALTVALLALTYFWAQRRIR